MWRAHSTVNQEVPEEGRHRHDMYHVHCCIVPLTQRASKRGQCSCHVSGSLQSYDVFQVDVSSQCTRVCCACVLCVVCVVCLCLCPCQCLCLCLRLRLCLLDSVSV
jgi:hypothetical protein